MPYVKTGIPRGPKPKRVKLGCSWCWNRVIKNRTAIHWVGAIMDVFQEPSVLRGHLASVVWWDHFGRNEGAAREPSFDRLMTENDRTVETTDSELERGLRKIGYPAKIAHRRLSGEWRGAKKKGGVA